MLKEKPEHNGIMTIYSESDEDVLIVDTAVEISVTTVVSIVGEDVEFIILLMVEADAT